MRKAQFAAIKHNSTATVISQNTMQNPNIEHIISAMANAINYHVVNRRVESEECLPTEFEIFSEKKYRLFKSSLDNLAEPEIKSIQDFLSHIFREEKLDAEVAIMSLAYIERVIVNKGVALFPNTWRRVVLGATILASKVWEDQSVWNVDYCPIFDALTAKDLRKLERLYLNMLEFNVGLSSSEYAMYYFNLQAYLTPEPMAVDKARAEKLQEKSMQKESLLKRHAIKKTNSLSALFLDLAVEKTSPTQPYSNANK
eukprot:TRINITY_DN3438_c0_g1_i1.p1 TRINITY_DN3438_c0_g1~~TRINITY_DN3438_c0_g1_i1.p1  ORF type:complete len:256 (-),score=60.18 TRINITY_DN3438_c0_g1_i1:45-812(-)